MTIKGIALRVFPEKVVCGGQAQLLLRLSCEIFKELNLLTLPLRNSRSCDAHYCARFEGILILLPEPVLEISSKVKLTCGFSQWESSVLMNVLLKPSSLCLVMSCWDIPPLAELAWRAKESGHARSQHLVPACFPFSCIIIVADATPVHKRRC